MKNPSGPPPILTLVLVTLLGAFSTSILLPSLPAMTEEFSTTAAVSQFAISSYLATTAVLQLAIGPLSDRYGRRPIMLWSVFIFIVGTLVCLFAPSMEILIIGRIVQGTAIAGVVLSRAVVRDLYSAEEAASRIGYITMGMAIALMLAPAIGGIIDEWIGWRYNVWAMLLLGIAVFLIAYVTAGETNKSEFSSFKEQLSEYPGLLKSPRFWGVSLAAAFGGGTYFAFLGGGSFVAINIFKLTPSQFGLLLGVLPLGYAFGNFISGRVASRFGTNTMAISGNVLTTIGTALPIFVLMMGSYDLVLVFSPMFIVALGNGISLPSINAAMVSVRPRLAGTASGLGGTIQLSGSALVSILAGWAVARFAAPYTLFVIMTGTSFLAVLASLFVLWRTMQLRGRGADDVI